MIRKALAVLLFGTVLTTAPALAQAADPSADCKLPSRTFLSEGTTNWASFPRPVGRLRVALLFRGIGNPAAEVSRLKPAEQWFGTSSYGRYTLELVQGPSVTLDATPPGNLTGDVAAPVTGSGLAASTVWGRAAEQADSRFDFSAIDSVFLVDAGTSRSYAEFENVTLDGKTIRAGATLGTDWPGHRHLLFAHEHGHTISLPDLYGGTGGHGYIGGWDLMGNLGGPSPDLFAWHKWKLGWLDDQQVSCVRTYNTATEQTITPLETAGGTKAIVVRYADTRAYVAEVRTRRGNNSASCDTGVLIYSVDSAVQSGSGPVRVKDSRPGSGGCSGHEFNDGAWDPGQTFTDSAAGVKIQVLSQSGENYVVRATYGTVTGSTVFSDDFETAKGWTAGTGDTATTGRFERGDPEATVFNGTTYQRGDTTSGTSALVTGRLAGADAGTYDVDGGLTSMRSPEITLPAGTVTLTFRWYLAHADNATAADYFRVSAGGRVLFEKRASASHAAGAWQSGSADLSALAGQRVQITVEAADAEGGSLVEAAVDDVRITVA
ncbi:hypothetical protein [Longispora albida]|uniref:hypothetical protein n=1 Tax=Longispora albida TaxID=203523 RepID=UPI0003719A70|nr:hypothetical protein [Longispora albida]